MSGKEISGIGEHGLGRSYGIPPELLDRLFCPTCALPLSREPVGDAFAIGWSCVVGHRFHLALGDSISQDMTEVASPPTGGWKVLRTWSEDPRLRSHINKQLAHVFRRIAEIRLDGRRIARHSYSMLDSFCPLCGGRLVCSPKDTDWGYGFRCANGHRFELRGGLNFRGVEAIVCLQADYADEEVIFLAGRYVKDPQDYYRLDPLVKRLLESFVEEEETRGGQTRRPQ
ncbi:MAG: hypothetical protein JJU36_13420 [Phycisphaeraceae bacterium]|nr:hypothetical protein [Phycisphaeraceae bacterium]